MRPVSVTAPGLTERAFQQQVVDLATLCGWAHMHVLEMRRSDPGWPDLVLCRPPELLVVELKTATGRLRPEQERWLKALGQCGVEVHCWRPADFQRVQQRLRRRSAAPTLGSRQLVAEEQQ